MSDIVSADRIRQLTQEVKHLKVTLKTLNEGLDKLLEQDPCDNDGQGCPWPQHIQDLRKTL